MKRMSLFLAAIVLGVFLPQCGSNTVSNPQVPENDARIIGTWSFSLRYNPDTTFNIIMMYDSSYDYRITVNINGSDTMEIETGTWSIASNSSTKQDTVWMDRMSCKQINLMTQTLDSIDCGIPRTGIRVDLISSGSWQIPLGDFTKYMPPGIIPGGYVLPQVVFVKST